MVEFSEKITIFVEEEANKSLLLFIALKFLFWPG